MQLQLQKRENNHKIGRTFKKKIWKNIEAKTEK